MVCFVRLFLFYLINISIYAYQIVPFIPKDKSSNLLYQTSDDQVRYLMQNQNALFLVEMSKSTQIHKTNSEFAQYEITSSKSKKNLLVTVDESPFLDLNPNKNKSIYWSTFKGTNLNLLGMGSSAKLHHDDQWVSYFDAHKKTIHFESMQMLGKNSYTINLNNKYSMYYIPEVHMVDHEQVLYTDLNEKGEEAVISYNLKNKTFVFIHKTVGSGNKLSLCLQNSDILISEFSLNSNEQVSVFQLNYRGSRNFSEKKNYFSTKGKFLPRILCSPHDSSFFLLKSSTSNEKQQFGNQSTLINISMPKLNSVEIPFDRSFSQFFTMDERVMLQSSGRIYQVVK